MTYRLDIATGVATFNGTPTGGGGGAWALIERRTMSGQASEVFSNIFDGTYTTYKFILENVTLSAVTDLDMVTLDVSNVAQAYLAQQVGYTQTGSSTVSGVYSALSSFKSVTNNSSLYTGQAIYAEIDICDPLSSTGSGRMSTTFPQTNAGPPLYANHRFSWFGGSPSWKGVSFVPGTGTINTGYITLHGLSTS